MTHQPQEALLKVMCSEHFPKNEGYYKTNIGEIYYSVKYVSFINEFGSKLNPNHWYEPATRIVLTEEEYSGICMKQYDEGYSDATKEARDEIANNYRPNDN